MILFDCVAISRDSKIGSSVYVSKSVSHLIIASLDHPTQILKIIRYVLECGYC